MELAVQDALAQLKRRAVQLSKREEIAQVAAISAGSQAFGELIAEAFDQVGPDGVIRLEMGKKTETYLEFTEGIKFQKGYVSPMMINKPEIDAAVLEKPLVLVTDDRISYIYELMPILERVVATRRPLFIIAEDIAVDLLGLLLSNKKRGTMHVVVVPTPGYGDRRQAYLEDVATLTGATVLSKDRGIAVEEATAEHLGTARQITVDKDTTTILTDGSTKEAVAQRAEELRQQIARLQDGWTKEKLQERLGWLSSGICFIKAGGTTETEANEAKYRLEDALNSARMAIQHGILPGGGSSLYRVGKQLQQTRLIDPEENIGYQLVAEALLMPLQQIAENAGKNSADILDIMTEQPEGFGYDASQDRFVDLRQAGIIDAAQVTISALENAASIAALVIDAEGLIVRDR